jgi:hypothetical protein
VHRHLRLEFPDPLAGRGQLGLLGRGHPRLQAAVDAVLAPPVADRLDADPEIVGDLATLPPASTTHHEHPPTELRRVATLPHAVLLQQSSIRVRLRDSTKSRADQSPHQTWGGSELGMLMGALQHNQSVKEIRRDSWRDHPNAPTADEL